MNKMMYTSVLGLVASLQYTIATPSYESMSDVTDAFEHIHMCGWGFSKGRIMVGQLEFPTDTRVAARLPFHKDGSYCTALYAGRKLMFYAHGYDPIHVVSTNLVDPGVFDAGTCRFTTSSPENLRTLEAAVTVDKPEVLTQPITAALSINNYDYLWDDAGYSCGASRIVKVASLKVEDNGSIHFEGLSRIPYYLNLSSKGFITQKIKIDPEADGVINLGNIELLSATKLKITYRARIRKNGGEWQTDEAFRTGTIICNGLNEFTFTKMRDGLGNGLDLRFKPQDDGSVKASFFYWGEDNFRILGNIQPGEAPDFAEIDLSSHKGMAYLPVVDNELYLFRKYDVNDTDMEVIFTTERL